MKKIFVFALAFCITLLCGCKKDPITTSDSLLEEIVTENISSDNVPSKQEENNNTSKTNSSVAKNPNPSSSKNESGNKPYSSKPVISSDDEDYTYSAPEGTTVDYSKLELTFSDEFDGNTLDTTKWEVCPGWLRDDCWWGRPNNSIVKNGNLHLTVTGNEAPYDAGAIRTSGKFSQTYGYFETRCKLPTTSGICAAFWLMTGGANHVGVPGGSDGAEIDILESHDIANNGIQHAIHWDGYGSGHKMANYPMNIPGIYQGYHTYGFEWTEDKYRFFVNGKLTWETYAGGICQVPAYLKLTLGIGGWVGTISPQKVPTDGMVVDYVRVYKFK